MKIIVRLLLLFVLQASYCKAQLLSAVKTNFSLAGTAIYVDSADYPLVKKSAELLQQDMEAVTGNRPAIVFSFNKPYKNLIVIGSRQSALIKELQQKKLLNLQAIAGKWEAYQIQTIDVSRVFMPSGQFLVIAGSDRRGTAYGVFELSKQIGVSPWYWWADVPVKKQADVYINTAAKITDAPKVKYRGFFINDEAPCLSNWSREKFGGFNHLFYEKVFELMLRLKGNYLWPAMWGSAFNTDDTLNPVKADEWGIVMGTSHHEPMLRAQQEWKKFGKGAWDYTKNDTILRDFWKKGIENMGKHESIVTVGMRGDGDMPMTQGTATALLERIVADQRKILEDVTKKPASATPQLWALYKEVQDYYDKGMRVPDDVTLLLCDDNWGNIRKLPRPDEKPRAGGYGIYYHFDYVGGPRNYKWLNTNSIPRVWEQMHLAYEYNVRNIWVVNVGDIKPMEYPISFFLDYAWNPDKIGPQDIKKYTENWCEQQFGKKYAADIAEIMAKYTKYNSRRKPEMVDATTYSLENYGEFSDVVAYYNQLALQAANIAKKLPAEYADAYFQLVLHPVKACANLNDMYFNAAQNRASYEKGNKAAALFADAVKELYLRDSMLTLQYHRLNNGKWNHMMSQVHIGYRSWQEPRANRMPDVKYPGPDSVVNTAIQNAAGTGIHNTEEEESENSGLIYIKSLVKDKKNPVIYEFNKYISIAADHYSRAVNTNGITWQILPDHGRTGNALTAFPVTAKAQQPAGNAPHVEYDFYTSSKGECSLNAYFSPTLNYNNLPEGLQYAVSIDNETPQIISINKDDKSTEGGINYKWVGDNIIIKISKHSISQPGKHVLKYWMVTPGTVLQKLVSDFGGLKPSYLGPPETMNKL